MELAERLGPSIDWWMEAPLAYALWCWHQLRDLDHVRHWQQRAARLEAAELMMLAVNEPKRLADERRRLLADAAGRSTAARTAAQRDQGLSLVRRIGRARTRSG